MVSKNWGGKREGSGKPRGKWPVKKVMLSLPEHLVEALDKAAYAQSGGGSRSALVAELLAKALKVKL